MIFQMKKITLLLILVITTIACDKVKNPGGNNGSTTGGTTGGVITCTLNTPVVKTNTAISGFRKVLVEDYTGHTCGNCPRAAEKIEAILTQYQDSVVAIAIHAGTQFSPPVPPKYPDDFRTEAGSDWDTYFGISAAGLPKGMVNRATTPYPKAYNSWPALVETNLHKPQSVKMDITTYFDVAAKLLNVSVKTTYISAFTNNTKLCLVITEDSIVGSQKDYNPPGGVTVVDGDRRPDYVFEHTMRGAINSSWGELVKISAAANDTITKSYTCRPVNCNNTKHASLVAFIYDDATKEILQAEKVKLR